MEFRRVLFRSVLPVGGPGRSGAQEHTQQPLQDPARRRSDPHPPRRARISELAPPGGVRRPLPRAARYGAPPAPGLRSEAAEEGRDVGAEIVDGIAAFHYDQRRTSRYGDFQADNRLILRLHPEEEKR